MKHLMLLLLVISFNEIGIATIKDDHVDYSVYSKEICIPEEESFDEKVYKEIVSIGIEYPEIVFRQAMLETGGFSSVIFNENCNLFGMRLARSRYTTALGENRSHAVYEKWQDSVEDYKCWQDYNFVRDSCEGNYYKYLVQRKYATDRSYIFKLKSVNIINFEKNV